MRTRGAWDTMVLKDQVMGDCSDMIAISPIPTIEEEVECRQIRNGGYDIAHCYGPDGASNAALLAAAPDMAAAIDCMLRQGLTKETRKKARAALRKARTVNP